MQIFLIAAISKNGMIAEKEGQTTLDWTSREDMDFFVKKTKEAGVVIMGRKTFDTIGNPLVDRLNIVMTRSATGRGHVPAMLEFTERPPQEIIKDILSRGYKDIAIIGGAEIFKQFLDTGLITDLFLTSEPVVFEKGIPFPEFNKDKYKLKEIIKLNETAILNHYKK
jgi:dihydrofolate reductase